MAHEVQLDVSVVLLPHLDFCDLLLERPMAMWNIFVFTIKSKTSLMVTSMHLPCGRSLKCVQDSAYHIKISTSLFIFFYFVIVSLVLFFQYQLLFLAPFLPITYCNSLEKWGPCGTVFEKEANKEKVKTNGNKLTCPVPPPPPDPRPPNARKT